MIRERSLADDVAAITLNALAKDKRDRYTGAGGSPAERVHTAGSLLLYLVQWRELKGFAWDVAEQFRRQG